MNGPQDNHSLASRSFGSSYQPANSNTGTEYSVDQPGSTVLSSYNSGYTRDASMYGSPANQPGTVAGVDSTQHCIEGTYMLSDRQTVVLDGFCYYPPAENQDLGYEWHPVIPLRWIKGDADQQELVRRIFSWKRVGCGHVSCIYKVEIPLGNSKALCPNYTEHLDAFNSIANLLRAQVYNRGRDILVKTVDECTANQLLQGNWPAIDREREPNENLTMPRLQGLYLVLVQKSITSC
jgi:hypothetical protein